MSNKTRGVYQFGPFEFTVMSRVLTKRGRLISLTGKEEMLLISLLEGGGGLLSHDELRKRLWPGEKREEGNLSFQIHALRRKLGHDGAGQSYICNISGRGFRLILPVRLIDDPLEKPWTGATAGATEPQDNDRESNASVVLPVDSDQKRVRAGTYVAAGIAALLVVTAIAFRSASAPVSTRLICCAQITHDGLPKSYPFLATDGVRLYFQEISGEGRLTASVSIEGGEVNHLSNVPPQFNALDLSPQGNELLGTFSPLFESEGEVWVVPLPAGSPRRVRNLVARAASWSPDGRSIVFVAEHSMYLAKPDGSGVRKVADLPGVASDPRWSPDGARIRFQLAEQDNSGGTLWEVQPGAGMPHPLISDWEGRRIDRPGGWSPDGRSFFFVSSRLGTYDVWDLPANGFFSRGKPEPLRLTNVPFLIEGIAASRDGRKLFAIGTHDMPEVGRFDPHVGQFIPFPEFSGAPAYWITFSPDNQRVAYTTYPDENLWTAKADGSDPVQLTFSPMHVVGLSWSPDGSRIAFRAQNPGGRWKLYLISTQDRKLRELSTGGGDSGVPTWSADGGKLVYGDMPREFGHPTGTEAIRVYDLGSDGTTALPQSGGLWTSRWSPNGKYIAALTIAKQELQIFDLGSKSWRTLGPANVNEVIWSHDSKYLFYESLHANPGIFRMNPASGTIQKLCDFTGYPRLEQGFTLDPQDRPIVLHNRSTSEIYAFSVETP